MSKVRNFIKSAVFGGLLVLLPAAVLIALLVWIFGVVRHIISPLTTLIANAMFTEPRWQVYAVDAMVIVVITMFCFLFGVFVRTALGKMAWQYLEENFFLRFWGYSLIKETVAQFLGQKKSPFAEVAMIQLFGNETLACGFITDRHANGYCTVFVPTAPNPTSGGVFHVPAKHVHLLDVPIEGTMRSIISCGAGSKALLSRYDEIKAQALANLQTPEASTTPQLKVAEAQ